jgi:aminoglycoside/choline kinase family phosphotransferase
MTAETVTHGPIHQWLTHVLACPFHLTPLAGDASTRRYYRVSFASDRTLIVMDASADLPSFHAFMRLRAQWAAAEMPVPAVFHQDPVQGYAALSDFGDGVLLDALSEENVEGHYRAASGILLAMQALPTDAVPVATAADYQAEMQLYLTWYLDRHWGQATPDRTAAFQAMCDRILGVMAEIPVCLVHRDFHARNLMVRPDGTLGLLDFQDAHIGTLVYDWVSLVKDCYVVWPRERVLAWMADYYAKLCAAGRLSGVSQARFVRWCDVVGFQRHLKCMGIFCRLYYRDQKPNYLRYLEDIYHYLEACCMLYPDLFDRECLIR